MKLKYIAPLLLLVCAMAIPSHADSTITFTCTTCTTGAPTGTISGTGDLMVTWSTLGTFDVGNLSANPLFASFLTPGYTGTWGASASVPLFDMENQAGTGYFYDFVNDPRGSGIVSGSICTYGANCAWTDVGTYTVNAVASTPEPATLSLLFLGLAGMGLLVGRKRRENNLTA